VDMVATVAKGGGEIGENRFGSAGTPRFDEL
jgi:hypothetical protein